MLTAPEPVELMGQHGDEMHRAKHMSRDTKDPSAKAGGRDGRFGAMT